MIGVDLSFFDTIDIDIGDSSVFIAETDPVRTGARKTERCAVAGIHRQHRRSTTFHGAAVLVPGSGINDGVGGLVIARNSGSRAGRCSG